MTWLLVEDDNDIRNVVAVMMSVWGEKPLSFADGNAAWTWLDSVVNGTFTGELPDLALMDIRMPGYTGDKVAARIREIPTLKDIPIILMTAFSLSDAEVRTMIEQAGIDHLINKPLPDMEVFRSTLYRVRDERRQQLANRQPTQPSQPTAPQTPAQSATQEPVQPMTPPQPSQPLQSAQPAQTAAPSTQASAPTAQPPAPQPTQPTQPSAPQTSTQSTVQKPAQPTTPAQPVKSMSEKESK